LTAVLLPQAKGTPCHPSGENPVAVGTISGDREPDQPAQHGPPQPIQLLLIDIQGTTGGVITMAKRVIHELIDDIDGKPANETVAFGLDGIAYEIDLSTKNAAKLRDVLAPFAAAGTRVGRSPVAARRYPDSHGRSPAKADPDQNRAVRAWAQAKGLPVSDRGRIRQEYVDRYQAEAGR
jgi:hypothetical protein